MNIVLYNVFNSNGGPNIFGTEPWWWYFMNGFLNFNFAFLFAFLSFPILLFTYYFAFHLIVGIANVSFLASSSGRTYLALSFKLLYMYLWFGIFTFQAHKEER